MDGFDRPDTDADADENASILDGTADDVSSVSSKIIRVFLSSTFSDMAEERNLLLKEVYPKIQEYTKRKYGVNFQMVDMRWGVTNEAQNDHMTSTCCLKEIRNCQNISVGPNFVILMGQKYGYRPIPAFIDAEEYEIIHKLLADSDECEDLSVLDIWYLKDDNATPPQYVLQPINSILKNYDSSDDDLKKTSRDEWQDTFDEIRDLLMTGADLAFDAGKIGGQSKEKYFISVTQEEIELGLLQKAESASKKCLCFVRNIENLHENIGHHRAVKFVDLCPSDNGAPAKVDTEAQDLLKILREQTIPQTLNKENIVKLTTKWSDKGGINSTDNSDYLSQLARVFHDKMIWLVDQNLAKKQNDDDQQMKEIRHNLKIRNEWSRIFFGRVDTLKAVEKYLKDDANRSPFVVHGESGCGKTAVIAKCARETKRWMATTNPVIISRFLGTSPQSSHVLLMLIGLCTQICDVYKLDKKDIPTEYKDVVAYFQLLFQRIGTEHRPLVIYLDSLDQLSTSFEPYNLQWLPKVLPSNVKIVLSLVPSVFNLLKRFHSHLIDRPSNLEPIAMLGDNLAMDIINTRLAESERTITLKQSQIISNLFGKCSLPLYSRVMLEEILTWKSYTSVHSNIVSSSIREALNNFFLRLENNHGRVLVRHALAYITAAREGISEMELLDILSLDDDVLNSVFLFWLPPSRRLPPFLWTKLRLDLDVFLVTRDSGDVEVLTWYHRLFKEAAMERYFQDEDTVMKIHANLAEYFMGVWGGRQKPFKYSSFLKSRLALTTDTGAEDRNVPHQPLVFAQNKDGTMFNKRKLTELPYHLVLCKNVKNLSDICIFDYTWLWTKITVHGLQWLLEDLDLAQTTCDDNEIQTLADAIRIAGCVLNDHPECLCLELAGRLFDLIDTMPKIRQLVQQCDMQGRVHSAVVSPAQLYEVPISALTRSLEGSNDDIADAELIKRGTEIVSVALNGVVAKWDINKGTVIKDITIPKLTSRCDQNIGLIRSRDEKYIICMNITNKPTIYTLDADTLQVINTYKASATLNHTVIASQKYVCMDNAVFEIRTGKKVHDLNSYRKVKTFVTLAFTICEQFILIGGENFVEMFAIENAKRIAQLPVPQAVSVIELTSDGRLAIVGLIVDCVIKIFDINTDSATFGQEVVTYDPIKAFPNEIMVEESYATREVSEINLSHKQGAFVSLVKRKYPIIWSLKNVSTAPRLLKLPKGARQLRYLFQVKFTADDKYILAAELSPNVMMWDTITGNMVAIFEAHKNNLHHVMMSPRANMAVTIPKGDPVLKIWDLQKVLKMQEVSSKKKQILSVKSVTFSNQSNLVFLSRVEPPKSSKAYHYIDYFGIDVLDLKTGKTGSLLPFDRYGPLQTITISKDASIFVCVAGTLNSSTVTVFDLSTKKVISSLNVPVCKSIKLSGNGEYMCIFTESSPTCVRFYSLPDMKQLGLCDNCLSGMFTKKNVFVGITETELLVRESVEEDETLKISLNSDVMAIHYCEVTEMLLITVDDDHQVSATAFKTEGFGAVGTITGISKGGISDLANDGSICIDSELQVFELVRCKRLKRLLPARRKSDITSIKLSNGGEHAVFIDSVPSSCVKVCRVSDSQIISTSFLHCVPELIEIVPALNIIVAMGKDKNLFILALRDCERTCNYSNREERLSEILGVESTTDVTDFEIPEKIREEVKEKAKAQQTKHMSITLNGSRASVGGVSSSKLSSRSGKSDSGNSVKSTSCLIL